MNVGGELESRGVGTLLWPEKKPTLNSVSKLIKSISNSFCLQIDEPEI